MSPIKTRIQEATKVAMKARDKARVAALRLINADIKRMEVDERKTLSDEDVLSVLARMVKQRQDSLSQYRDAGRDDLADREQFELDVIAEFMPAPLAAAELDALIAEAITTVGASGMRDMGKVIGWLRSRVQGRADIRAVSAKVKARLA